jgi:hypothetical protein
MMRLFGFSVACVALLVLSACASPYGHNPGYRAPAIPEGHMPPPGECRIWYPGLEPGQQPPPGPCGQLRHQVPPGAYLIWG